jgi:hypothetical protein
VRVAAASLAFKSICAASLRSPVRESAGCDFEYTAMAICRGYEDYRVIPPADELAKKD